MGTITEEADALYDKIPTSEEIEKFIEKHQETNGDAELLWRLARFSFILSKTHPNSAQKKNYANRIGEFANKGFELDPESAGCNKYFSIGIMEGTSSQSEKAKHVHVMKERFKKATEIEPQDAFAHYLLGTWHFRIADLPWLLKKIVNAVHSNPPTATYDEALELFQKADKLQPLLKNSMMMGKTYYRKKDYGKAKEHLQKALDSNPKRPEDEEFIKEAKDLLKGL